MYKLYPVAIVAVVLVAQPATAQLASPPVQADGDLVGSPATTYSVVKGDNLASIARQNHIGLVELLAANPAVTSQTISLNEQLTIPHQHVLPAGDRSGILVNLAALRLYRFDGTGQVMTFPVSVGKEGWDTPTGTTTVIEKRKDPTWKIPASIRAQDPSLPAEIPPGPKNPLGQYALTLNWPGYLIHGTNTPYSIGKPTSHGCMRLYPEDIESLFGAVSVGDSVTVIDTPFTLGESQGNLYLEVTPTREQAKAIASFTPAPALAPSDPVVQALLVKLNTLKSEGLQIDDQTVQAAMARHDGLPVIVAKGLPAGVLNAPQQARAAQTSAVPAMAVARATPPAKPQLQAAPQTPSQAPQAKSWWDQTKDAAANAMSNVSTWFNGAKS